MIYLIVKLFPALLSLISLMVFTRVLTPGEYGVYSLTILVAGLGNAVLLQWVTLGVSRYLPSAADAEEIGRLLATARTLSISISSLLILICLGIWLSGSLESFSVIFWMAGFLCAIQAWYDLNLKILNTNLKPVSYGKVLASKSLIVFFLAVSLLYLGCGVVGILLSTIIGLGVASLFSRNLWEGVPWFYIDKEYCRKLFAYGAPLMVTYLLIFIIDASDRFFIERMVGIEAVGIYSAAYEMSQYSIGTLTSVVHLAALPLVINAYSDHGAASAGDQLKKTFMFILAVAAPVSAGMAVTAPEIAHVMIGEAFSSEATKIIPWVALAMFLSAIKSFYFDYAFQLAKSTKKQMYIVFISALVNMVFNYILISEYGGVGAAISTAIAFFVSLFLSYYLGKKVFPMPNLPIFETFKILIATVVMVAVVTSLTIGLSVWSLAAKVVVGGGVYLGLLIFLNVTGVRAYMRILVARLNSIRTNR